MFMYIEQSQDERHLIILIMSDLIIHTKKNVTITHRMTETQPWGGLYQLEVDSNSSIKVLIGREMRYESSKAVDFDYYNFGK